MNQGGDFLFLTQEELSQILSGSFLDNPPLLNELKSKHFYCDSDCNLTLEMVATKLRSRKAFLRDFTALHMVVLTGYCNCNCDYCHASSEELSQIGRDNMSIITSERVVDMIFQTRSSSIKIEFQGGEPMVNWNTLTHIVEYAEKKNEEYKKNLSFVICTNLTLMDEEKASYCKNHNVYISSSLDGPKDLHDGHRRMRDGSSGYDRFIDKLDLCRRVIGPDSCSALVTLTKDHLPRITEVVDEYIKCGFHGVFLRSLNPYGLAKQRIDQLGYPVEDFLEAYKKAFYYILELNLSGTFFVENFASILLSRILTPYSTGFVDLQSPAGAGINGVIYDFNGDVYPTDEGRMLARVGDKKFRLGNVSEDSYEKIFFGKKLQDLIKHSCVEILPGCATCAYKSFCGSDPIRYYNECGDIVGHRPTSDFCKKYMGIMDFLFSFIMEANDDVIDVFWSWINHRPLREFRK